MILAPNSKISFKLAIKILFLVIFQPLIEYRVHRLTFIKNLAAYSNSPENVDAICLPCFYIFDLKCEKCGKKGDIFLFLGRAVAVIALPLHPYDHSSSFAI